jgi:protease I
MADLQGRKIAFVVANEGVERVELTEPWKAVEEAGGSPTLIAPKADKVQTFDHLDKSETFDVDLATAQAEVNEFDAVVLPGGVANPDQLRMDDAAVRFVREFVDSGKPVAVICHGPWTLVEAGVVDGRRLTSWPSLQTDIRNAGGEWTDEPLVRDGNLITSRKPDDLPVFCEALVEAVASS